MRRRTIVITHETAQVTINAREALRACHVPFHADFHTLSSAQVDALITEANRVKYRRPKNANGSRARYFHNRLQRKACTYLPSTFGGNHVGTE